jgi:MFS family permease
MAPARFALATLATLAIAMGVGRFAFTPLLPLMQADAGLSLTGGSWLAFANYLGYLVGALSAVWLRASAQRMVRAGLVATGALTLAMGLVHAFPLWWLLRFLGGVASAWALVFGSAYLLARLAAAGADRWSGVAFAGVGTGVVASGLICAALAALGFASQGIWIALAVVSLAVAVLVWPAFAERSAAAAAAAPASRRERWDFGTWVLILAYGGFGFGYIIPGTFLPVIARDALGAGFASTLFWPLFGVAAAASTLVCARLGARREHPVFAASFFAQGAGVVAPAIAPGVASIVAANLLVGATAMSITMLGMRQARLRVRSGNAAPLMGAMTASFGLGQLAGPVFAGYVVAWSGSFTPALWCAAGLLWTAGVALAALRRGA